MVAGFDPLERLRGIVTVLNTPFDAEGRVDAPALARNVAYAIEAGVAGFLAPAIASEVGRLSPGERLLVVDTILRAAAGRVPLVGGASAPTRAERRERAKELLAAGCDCILAALPFSDEAGWMADVEDLASLDPPCLMVQDWDPAGYGIPVEAIAKAFGRFGAFRSIKVEVVPAGRKYSEILAATGGRLHVCGGWAVTQLIEGLDRGVHGFLPTGMHRSYVSILRRYASGDRTGAIALFDRLSPVLAFSNQHSEVSIRFFKRLLWRQGIYPTADVREPLLPFDSFHIRIADELIDRVLALETELGGWRAPP
ncbi:MAG: dihydrodipicolinate synthase family protein [Spirochaetota bacterium]